MRSTFRFAACFILGLSLLESLTGPTFATSQSVSKNQSAIKPNTTEPPVTKEQRALVLLDQLLAQTSDFQGLTRSLKIALFQAEGADLLWTYDQPRARTLLETAVKSAATQLPRVPRGTRISPLDTYTYSAMCKEIVDLAAEHDTVFAEGLIALALVPFQADETKNSEFYPAYRQEQASLYSQLARRAAPSDPQRALALIRKSLNGWYSSDQIRALNALRHQAPLLADELFLKIIEMVRNKPTSISKKVGILSAYVFPDINNETGEDLRHSGENSQAQVSTALINAFLEFSYDSFTSQPLVSHVENNEFGFAFFDRYTMHELVSRFERYLPEKAPEFRARIEEVVEYIKKSGREDMWDSEGEMWEEMFRGNVREIIEKAEASKTQEERDRYYSEAAAILVYRDGDVEQALVLTEKVSENDRSRVSFFKELRGMRAAIAVQQGDAEKAYRYSKEEMGAFDRVRTLMGVAALFGKRGNIERAKEVLAEAAKEIQPNDEYQILRRADTAVEINPTLGFQIMKEAIEAINAAGSSGPRDTLSVGRDDGITYLYRRDFDRNLAVLARNDFNRALELAKSIKPKEASLLAQFAICKGVLAKPGSSTPEDGDKHSQKEPRQFKLR